MGIREKLHDGERLRAVGGKAKELASSAGLHDGERLRAAGGKAKEWWGSTGRPLSEAYARRAGGYAARGISKGGELVRSRKKSPRRVKISRKRQYKLPKGAGYYCHYCYKTFRSSRQRDRHQARCPVKRRYQSLGW